MQFLLVLALLVATAVLWSRLNQAYRDITTLRRDVDGLDQMRLEVRRLQRELDALRVELHGQVVVPPAAVSAPPPAPAPAVPAPPQVVPVPPPVEAPPVVSVASETARPAVAPPPVQPVRPAPVVPAGRSPASAPERESLETRIGSRWLLYIGVVAIVFGAAYFVKLALDNEWITESGRVAIGAAVGVALVYAGARFSKAGYALYGQMVSGGGVAVLYVSIYGAFNFYHLISRPVAFTLMAIVTAGAAWLADRQRSQGLALMAIGGGFATPFLLSSGADAAVALFVYDATLVAGTMYLARRQDWWGLNLVSYLSTVVTFMGWAGRFYTPDKYLTTEGFLTLFCGMFLYVLYEARRSERQLTRLVGMILWSAPVLYYVASLANLLNHSVPFLVFLIALGTAGIVAGRTIGPSWIRLVFWAADVVPLFLWIEGHTGSRWLTPGLVTVAAIYLLNLIAQLDAIVRGAERLDEVDIGLLHGNGLVACGAGYLLIDAVRSDLTAPVVAAFAIWHGAIALWLAKRDRGDAIHAGALAGTLLTAAIALAFDGAAVTAAWAAEGAAVIWIGLRERREWLRVGGVFLLAIAIVRLIQLQFADPPVGQTFLLNPRAACAVFIVALMYGLAWTRHRARETLGRSTEVAVALVTAKLLVLSLVSSEIVAYWMLHPAPRFIQTAEIVTASLFVGTAIMWLGLVRREELVRVVGGVCVALAAMSLLSIQLEAAPRDYTVILNARAAAGVIFVLGLCGLAVLHRRLGGHVGDLPFQIGGLLVMASLFTLSLLTSEINAFWEARGEAHTWSVAREALQSIAWSGLGSVVVWFGLTSRRTGTRLIGWGVLAVAVARLVRLSLAHAPDTYVVLANPRLVASAIVIAFLYALAVLYGRLADPRTESVNARRILFVVANALTLLAFTSEITAFWDLRRAPTAASARSGRFAREMMLSITWAVYATALIVAGIRKGYAPIRYFAMVVFGVTILKVFLIDLAELDRIYRVLSIVGLGVMLLVTSYLYQRSRPTPQE